MGLELGALLSLAVGAASTVASSIQAKKARKADAQAQAIQLASQRFENKIARRKSAREERIKRARIQASAEQAGAAGSSGEVGAVGALSANRASAEGAQRGLEGFSNAISASLQRGANLRSRSRETLAFGKLATTGIKVAEDFGIFD